LLVSRIGLLQIILHQVAVSCKASEIWAILKPIELTKGTPYFAILLLDSEDTLKVLNSLK
jgi:hypothetical protein